MAGEIPRDVSSLSYPVPPVETTTWCEFERELALSLRTLDREVLILEYRLEHVAGAREPHGRREEDGAPQLGSDADAHHDEGAGRASSRAPAAGGGDMDPRTTFRRTFDAAALTRDHPPRFRDGNKAAVHDRLKGGAAPSGTLEVSRWSEGALPVRRPAERPIVEERAGFFEYGEAAPAGTRHWHVNFATSDCFAFYAGGLLAQDELQTLEHPVLGSVREAAKAEGFSLLCVEHGWPTPVLVAGAERRGALETAPTPARPEGLYGNHFARAPRDQVLAALAVLDPPERTNLVAIEAPAHGRGAYRRDELAYVLSAAFSGFRAAVLETRRAAEGANLPPRAVVHTGFWGAGAYGGDRELMALLQLVAAELAEVDELVFYTARAEGAVPFAAAVRRHEALPAAATSEELVRRVLALGYAWGVGDGT